MAYKKDNNELLFFILRQLVSEQRTFNRNRFGDGIEVVEISEDEFVEKVRDRINALIKYIVIVSVMYWLCLVGNIGLVYCLLNV